MYCLFYTAYEDQILWYAFDAQTYEHTLMLTTDEQHSNNYLIEIISPVNSIEMSGAYVVIPDPILICVIDIESKKSVKSALYIFAIIIIQYYSFCRIH